MDAIVIGVPPSTPTPSQVSEPLIQDTFMPQDPSPSTSTQILNAPVQYAYLSPDPSSNNSSTLNLNALIGDVLLSPNPSPSTSITSKHDEASGSPTPGTARPTQKRKRKQNIPQQLSVHHKKPTNAFKTRPDPIFDQKTIPLSSGLMNGPSGPTAFVYEMESKDPVDLYRLFFDENIIETIVFQSNLYAQQSGKRFIPTTRVEIETFLGINILMGIKKLPS